MSLKVPLVVAGLGVTDQGRIPGKTDLDFKVESLQLALADCGILPGEVDGFIFQPGLTDLTAYGRGGEVVKSLGMNPNFIWTVQSGGTSAIAMLAMACGAIQNGLASVVALNYGDAALSARTVVGASNGTKRDNATVYGMYSPGAVHAMAAMRHMHVFGTTKEQLGAVPAAARAYANLRPDAFLHGQTLTLDDYLRGHPVAEPLNRYDYCLVADGGSSLIVTSTARARSLHSTPVGIAGMGFSLPQDLVYARGQYEAVGVTRARDHAFSMADIAVEDIDVAQLYDCFSINVLLTLEGYGFCKQGESGPFVAEGNIAPGGRLPVNTAGGELAWGYQQGFTPLVEGVRQMRGEGGRSQVLGAEVCLVTGHGGVMGSGGNMDYAESCVILMAG